VIVGWEAFVLDFDDVAPAVGLGSVGVGEAVDRCQLACAMVIRCTAAFTRS